MFKLYSPPLTISIIREKGVWYTTSLVNILRLLHDPKGLNIAHLNVRIPNVCFDPETTLLALIDFDQSCSVHTLQQTIILIVTRPPDTMYMKFLKVGNVTRLTGSNLEFSWALYILNSLKMISFVSLL